MMWCDVAVAVAIEFCHTSQTLTYYSWIEWKWERVRMWEGKKDEGSKRKSEKMKERERKKMMKEVWEYDRERGIWGVRK